MLPDTMTQSNNMSLFYAARYNDTFLCRFYGYNRVIFQIHVEIDIIVLRIGSYGYSIWLLDRYINMRIAYMKHLKH